jgi:hypothetical protein
MNIYRIRDTDGGNSCYIVANGIRSAVDIFIKEYKYEPEDVYKITEANELVYIDKK